VLRAKEAFKKYKKDRENKIKELERLEISQGRESSLPPQRWLRFHRHYSARKTKVFSAIEDHFIFNFHLLERIRA
jgi:hypothetical protein